MKIKTLKTFSCSGIERIAFPLRSLRGKAAILILFGLMFSVGSLSAQGSDVTARLSANPDQLLVGDQSKVVLKIEHNPSQTRISWPLIPDSFGKLEVLSKSKIDTTHSGPLTTYSQQLLVTGFDSGLFSIPPIQVSVAPLTGTSYSIFSDSVELLVQTVPVDTTKPFKPIKSIIAVKSSWLDYIWWIVGSIIAVLAILFLVLYLRRKKLEPAPVAVPEEPMHLRFLRELEKLEMEQVWQKGDVKAYYVRLTDILRSYIELRFGVPALERTTEELHGIARRNSALAPYAEKIYSVLFTADFAKFARAEPTPTEHLASMQITREFIMATVPTPASPNSEPEKP